MGMKYADEPFNMGMLFYFFLNMASFKMGTFSDPQHTSGHFHTGVIPPPPGKIYFSRTAHTIYTFDTFGLNNLLQIYYCE